MRQGRLFDLFGRHHTLLVRLWRWNCMYLRGCQFLESWYLSSESPFSMSPSKGHRRAEKIFCKILKARENDFFFKLGACIVISVEEKGNQLYRYWPRFHHYSRLRHFKAGFSTFQDVAGTWPSTTKRDGNDSLLKECIDILTKRNDFSRLVDNFSTNWLTV